MHSLLKKISQAPSISKELENSFFNKNYKCKAISFVNPYSYHLLRNNESTHSNIDHYYVDGIYSSSVFSMLFKKKIKRVSFDSTSFATIFFRFVESHQLPVFILGSTQKQLENAINQFKSTYPKLNICGYHNGYFVDDQEVIADIASSGAKYVICGLGTPKQDLFIQKVKNLLSHQVKQVYTCGGFLHQTQQSIYYYPMLIDKLHLRWLYRAINEPGVARRLLTKYPTFIFYALKDSLKNSH